MGSSFSLLILLYSGIRLVGFAVAVGYGLYKKKKMTIEIEPMPEAIDISVEQPKEEGSRK